VSQLRILLVVAGVGVISGLLGNSGGFLLAPLFIAVLRMPMRRALGTSLALATLLAIPGTITHAALGHIDWAVTATLACGAAPMAMIGARFALRLRDSALVLSYGLGLTALAGGLLLFAR
jgi:uncharacterized membrane protein YfcA